MFQMLKCAKQIFIISFMYIHTAGNDKIDRDTNRLEIVTSKLNKGATFRPCVTQP